MTTKSNAIHFLNFHFGLQTFAESVTNIFGSVYLYQMGVPLWGIFLVFSAIFLVRLGITPLYVHFCQRFGLRRLLILGTVLYIGKFLMLSLVSGVNLWLGIYALYAGVQETTYWFSYHTYYALLGTSENRGKESGFRLLSMNLATISAPLVSGFLVHSYNFGAAFFVATLAITLSVLPLLYTPKIAVSHHLPFQQAVTKVDKIGFALFFSEGFYEAFNTALWVLVLFLFLQDYLALGSLISLAMIFQAVIAYFLGHLLDIGKIKAINLMLVGAFLAVVGLIGRTFFAYNIPSIIACDLIFVLAYGIYQPVLLVTFYNASKKSPSPLWFQGFAEAGWFLGSIAAYLGIMIGLWAGLPARLLLLGGIVGMVLLCVCIGNLRSKTRLAIPGTPPQKLMQ